jgi:hypothetical protein
LDDDRDRASGTSKKLSELGVNMLVAAIHRELDVLNDLQHGSAFIERLWRHARAVAVMDAVVRA